MKNKLIEIFIFLIFLFEVSFFYLFKFSEPINSFVGYSNKMGLVIIVLIMLYALFILRKIKNGVGIFTIEVILFILLVLIEILLSYFRYKQSFTDILFVSNHYFVILFYFILLYYIKHSGRVQYINNLFIYFTIILSVLFLIQINLYDKGIIFLNIGTERTRFGLRIYESNYFIAIGSILGANALVYSNKFNEKITGLSAAALGFLSTIFAYKGRTLVLVLLIVFLFIIIEKYKKRVITLMTTLTICLIVGIKIFGPTIAEYVELFSTNTNSYTARVGAVEFYTKELIKEPVFGQGFIRANKYSDEFYLVHGSQGKFYKNDIGIIGYTSTFGLTGLILYLAILIKIFLIIKKAHKIIPNSIMMDLKGIYLFILLTIFLLSITDRERIFYLPIILIYSEVVNIYYKNFKIKNRS